MAQRRNGGMLYIQISFAFIFGLGAIALGVAAPPPDGLQWLVIVVGIALTLAGIGGILYAALRVRR